MHPRGPVAKKQILQSKIVAVNTEVTGMARHGHL